MLVVEDDEVAREALQQLFEHHHWQVTAAATVREAHLALLQPLQWVVLDLLLPDGDGASVLEFIRRKRMDVGVLVVTGASDPEHLRYVASLEPEALLQKPVDFQDMLRFIEQPDADADIDAAPDA